MRLIDHERKIELEKLQAYYPNDLEMQNIRWKRESQKLDSTFPFLIAQGNFLNATAMFEIYVLLLVKSVETESLRQLKDIKGQGVTRALNFLKANSVLYANMQNWEQVSIAITFRNCIVHASGSLAYFRNGSQIKNIVENKRFLSPDILKWRQELGSDVNEVFLGIHPILGERLVITNSYSHWITFVLRGFFSGLCLNVLEKIDK